MPGAVLSLCTMCWHGTIDRRRLTLARMLCRVASLCVLCRSGLLPDSPLRTFTHKNKALSHIIKGMGPPM